MDKSNVLVEKLVHDIDYVPCTIPLSKGKAKLIMLADNGAVIKMTIKGRSPNMRHVPRTHRVDLDWLFERFKRDKGVNIKYVSTKKQIADLLTKGSFSAEQWNNLCKMMQVGTIMTQ